MRARPCSLWLAALALPVALLPAGKAKACDIPMFQYALENWAPDVYEAYVFHRGSLSGEAKRALQFLRAESVEGRGTANIVVREVDLSSSSPSGRALKLWQAAEGKGASLPWVVVKYPATSGIPASAWSGPLTLSAVRRLLISPARRRIADLIVGGSTAVWVLIDGRSKEESDRVARRLKRLLSKAEGTLKIQFLDPVTGDFSEGRPEFPLVRVSRADRREEAFTKTILNTEPGLERVSEPMAFPVFGRGRALALFVGDEIDEDNVMDACQFLCAWCSCVVKAQNPGVDLLMAVNWDEALEEGEVGPEEAPQRPPTSASPFGAPKAPSSEAGPAVRAKKKAAKPAPAGTGPEKPQKVGRKAKAPSERAVPKGEKREGKAKAGAKPKSAPRSSKEKAGAVEERPERQVTARPLSPSKLREAKRKAEAVQPPTAADPALLQEARKGGLKASLRRGLVWAGAGLMLGALLLSLLMALLGRRRAG